MADSGLKGGKFSAPGFRFHPTDEELVMYYLKRKICSRKLRINAIGVVDVYKMDPAELPAQSLLKTGDRQWFFFTPRNRKYPNAARSSRGTATGYWKATGKDRIIVYNSRPVGLKKTLVFYRGRAPNGERTDWVMHEYTMDEDELVTCTNVKDYYALYKLFKKSGAGPKNGEQYGAPFQEEEWVDDDNEDGVNTAVPEVPYENTRGLDDSMLFNPGNLQLDDLDELLKVIPDAPGIPTRCINGLASSIPQVDSEQELQSTLVDNSPREFPNAPQIGGLWPNGQQYNRPSSFESLVSANSFEATEVTSAPNTSGMIPLGFEKENYIEMDDLLTPELGGSSSDKPPQFMNHAEFGDFNGFGQFFHDGSMSFDMEPIAQGTSTYPTSLSNVANNTSDQKQDFLYQRYQDLTPEGQLNNFMGPSPTLDHFTDGMWLQDDQAVLFDQQQSFSGEFASPSSGVMPGSTNPTMAVSTQDQEGQNDGGTSPISSALWAFLDAIPSTPASACEGPLNRTFVRMSSFSRIRFSGKTNGTPVTTTIAKQRSRNRGFILLSIVGALCAIFWVFVATVRISGRPIFS